MHQNFLFKPRLPVLLAFILLASVIAGCVQPSASSPTNEPGVQIRLLDAPDGAETETLSIEVMDGEGNPVIDATVSLEGNMNHAGMAPVIGEGVQDDGDGTADGVYQVPFAFSMMGDWIITVAVEMPDGSTVQQDIELLVNKNGMELK